MSAIIHPTTIQRIGNELAIAWSDGIETYFELENLRRACPCAACGGEPDVMGEVIRPDVSYTDGSFNLRGYESIGGYGFQPTWADGHRTGIYSYQYLRKLASGGPE